MSAALGAAALIGGLFVVTNPATVMTASAEEAIAGQTTDISAQPRNRAGGGGAQRVQRAAPGPRPRAGGNVNVNRNVNRNINRGVNVNRNVNRNINRGVNVNRNVNRNINRNVNRNINRTVHVNRVGPRVGSTRANVRLGGRHVVLVRGRHHASWRGRRWWVVPVATLGALTVAGIAYSAWAYAPVVQSACTGYTEDGCFFRWAEVPTEEGELIPQCVSYCPQ
jgi:hypothetical protein